MIRLSGGRRRLAALLASMILAASSAGCGSSQTSATPLATARSEVSSVEPSSAGAETPEASDELPPETSSASLPTTGVLAGGAKLAAVSSYRFKLTMQGSGFDDYTQPLGVGPGEPFSLEGTIVRRPSKAASLKTEGMEVVQVGTDAWLNMDTGWIPTESGGLPSIVDTLAPDVVYPAVVGGTQNEDWAVVGDETKNGVAAVHYRAEGSSLAILEEHLGADAGTASADVWLAKAGGYPVSTAIAGKSGNDPARFVMDVMRVDDPANTVTPPPA